MVYNLVTYHHIDFLWVPTRVVGPQGRRRMVDPIFLIKERLTLVASRFGRFVSFYSFIET